jgi:DNA-binding ferritin-like protein
MYTPGPQTVAVAQTPAPQAAPEPQAKPKAPSKSKNGDVGAFIQQLISLMGYIHQLQVQSHLLHLNYEAPNFLGIHAFLKDQYEAHLSQFDTIGEFIRSLDYLTPMCSEGLMQATPQFKHCVSYKPSEMLGTYYKNLEELGMMAKKLEKVAAKVDAVDVQNYLAELVGETFKAAWFLKASLRNA